MKNEKSKNSRNQITDSTIKQQIQTREKENKKRYISEILKFDLLLFVCNCFFNIYILVLLKSSYEKTSRHLVYQ